MLRFAAVLVIGACSLSTVRAQGTFQFTWHGNSSLFQASFSVTEAEMQPGATWDSPVFYTSIAITSLSGLTYHYDNPSNSAASGGCYANGTGWDFDFWFVDFAHGTELLAGGQEYAGDGLIQEKPIFANQDLWSEPGYWTTVHVPEPSTTVLLVLGAATLVARRGRDGF